MFEAYHAALEAYLIRYPEKSSDTAGEEVARLIFEASAREPGREFRRQMGRRAEEARQLR